MLRDVALHYAHGDLRARFFSAVEAAALDPDSLTVEDLATADEFHIGGRAATIELFDQVGISPDMHVLDIGSGLGGPARLLASRYGCRVTGVDLTPAYVTLATELTERTGLSEKVTFREANALNLPFAQATFDGAYVLHVGMNIEDKATLFSQAATVVRPGGFLVAYDIMRVGPGEVEYPVPWAGSAAISFLSDPEGYRTAITGAGFEIVSVRERLDIAREFFAQLRAAAGNPPPLGLHLVMGPDFRTKVAHMVQAVEGGVLAPVQMMARRVQLSP